MSVGSGELVGDIVDSCTPGDVVIINGEVKVVSTDEGKGYGKKKEQAMFMLYLSVNSVTGPSGAKAVETNPADGIGGGNDAGAAAAMVEFTLKVFDYCPFSTSDCKFVCVTVGVAD